MHDMNTDMPMEHGDMGGMGMGMDMMNMGPLVFGVPLNVILMIASGVFYLVCAIAIWKPFRREKNELVGALFAFLVYQAISMFFMGVEMKTMNIVYSNIAALAIFVGSAYMLKFPFSRLAESTRKIIFGLILIASLTVFAWFMQTPERQIDLMSLVLWYDLVANGIIVGGSILIFSFKTVERAMKTKATGGAAGVVSCCVGANLAMLGGAMFTSTIFAFLAPVFILYSLRSATNSTATTTTSTM